MSKEKKKGTTPTPPNKPKFSSYWIYGLIIIIFIAISMLTGSTGMGDGYK